jgi:subtilisin family serine protease
VAPGARLWALKTLGNNGSGYASWLICGIDQITKWKKDTDPNNDIEVANYSGGGSGTDTPNCGVDSKGTVVDPKHKAICNSTAAGVTYTIAAGNESGDFARWTPAAYDEVLTVTSVADFNGQAGGGAATTCLADQDDTGRDTSDTAKADTSDVGHTIAAPGACIYSTYKGRGYTTMSGTSMASPHVAGAAALCITSGRCSGTPSEVMTRLLSDAKTKSDTLASSYYGFTDDPNRPNSSRYYGHLVHVGGY